MTELIWQGKYQNDKLLNEWQNYRTKQNPNIELKAENIYEEKGKYVVVANLIDIISNDTTKAPEVKI